MCCRKKIYRNLSGYFYRKLYIRSFPSRMFSMQWRISQRIYTRSGIYIFNLSGISSNLHSFPQPFFFLSIVWISTIKIHANSEGFAIRTDHIGTCSLHIPLISLYLFLLLFFLQLYAFSVYIWVSRLWFVFAIRHFIMSDLRRFLGNFIPRSHSVITFFCPSYFPSSSRESRVLWDHCLH